MTMLIDAEREKYETIWAIPEYSEQSPGLRHLDQFMGMAGLSSGHGLTLLDAGCGSGKASLALQSKGFNVLLCDLTPAGLCPEARDLPFIAASVWDDLRTGRHIGIGGKRDYVFCCDVMEHIPPEFTMLAVTRLLDVARRGVFLSIAFFGDEFGKWVGDNLHLTVQPFTWWRDRLNGLGQIIECRDCIANGLFLVAPK